MEPLLLLVSGLWWIAPAAAGTGAVAYVGLTTRSRRARRLELDAARHEHAEAYRGYVAAKSRARVAYAEALTAKSRGAYTPGAADARRELAEARQHEKTAALELRASRARVRAGNAQYRAASPKDPLPIERLMALHDAVNARWLSYETDVELALAYPQMTDARHPATVVFLRAQREALVKRPMLKDRATPQQFAEYRIAVRALEHALIDAERAAGVRGTTPPRPADTAAASVAAAAAMIAEVAAQLPSLIPRPASSRGRTHA